MYKTVNERITYCRSLLKMTREELCKDWGEVSVPTLARWELGTTKTTDKKLEGMIGYFKDKGIIVFKEWLINGEGEPPINLTMEEFNEANFDDIAYQKFFLLQQKIKQFTFGSITSNYSSPYLRYGDYVSGINILKNKIHYLLDKLVFVFYEEDKSAGALVACENKEITLENIEKKIKTFSIDKITHIGEIQWIARRP